MGGRSLQSKQYREKRVLDAVGHQSVPLSLLLTRSGVSGTHIAPLLEDLVRLGKLQVTDDGVDPVYRKPAHQARETSL